MLADNRKVYFGEFSMTFASYLIFVKCKQYCLLPEC